MDSTVQRGAPGGYQLFNDRLLAVAPLATGTQTTPNGPSGDSRNSRTAYYSQSQVMHWH